MIPTIHSITVNLNFFGIMIAAIGMASFCMLSILYYFYIDRDRMIVYVTAYFAFSFCGLMSSSYMSINGMGQFLFLTNDILFTINLAFDYFILYCLLACITYLMQYPLKLLKPFMLMLIPFFIGIGYYFDFEIPFFFTYLSIIMMICVGITAIEIIHHSIAKNISYLAVFSGITTYYVLAYNIKIAGIILEGWDWIASVLLLGVAIIYFLVRYKQIVIEKEQIYSKLAHDEMTGLFSKNFLVEILKHTETGILIFVDVNHFKMVNDHYGHLMGDQLIIELSHFVIKERAINLIPCRFGGDEIALLIQQTTMEEVQFFLKRLIFMFKQILKNNEIDYKTLEIGLSIGVSEFDSFMGHEAIAEADFAMYKAKSTGNNQITFQESKEVL